MIHDLIKQCQELGDDTSSKLKLIASCDYSKLRRKAIILLNRDGSYKSRVKHINYLWELGLINDNDVTILGAQAQMDFEMAQDNFTRMMENEQNNNPKKMYKANKSKGIVSCPKCGSTSITTTNEKLSVTRGAVGGAILGQFGAGVGALTSKKYIVYV